MIRMLVALLMVGLVVYLMMFREGAELKNPEAMYKEQVEKVENLKLQVEQDAEARVQQIEEQTR